MIRLKTGTVKEPTIKVVITILMMKLVFPEVTLDLMALTKEEAARSTPRGKRDKDSWEYAFQTLTHLKEMAAAAESSRRRVRETIEQARDAEIYKRIPEDDPYGDMDTMLRETFGATEEELLREAADPLDSSQDSDRASEERKGDYNNLSSNAVTNVNPDRDEELRESLLSNKRRTGGDPSLLLDLLSELVERESWKKKGWSFLRYVQTDYDDGGLGWSDEEIENIINFKHKYEKDGPRQDPEKVAEMEELRSTIRDLLTPEANPHGGDRRSDEAKNQDSYNNLDPNERGSDYLRARIARDHPDVHERMKEGEFRSVRQAAIQAGIIDDIRTKQIRETDGPEKMKAKIRHVYGDEVADELFGGDSEEEGTDQEGVPSLEKLAVDSDPEDLFDISGLSRRQQNALLAGAISSSKPKASGLALRAHYDHEELAECFRTALEQVDEWDAEDIARVACGQSDELYFSDREDSEE